MTYFEELSSEEKRDITTSIQLLFQQTFLLERKYDKRTGRMQFNRQYRICYKHFSFLKKYFAIAGMELLENNSSGVIYLRGERVMGEKLSKLSTIYLLVLKVLYDEQMAVVSNSDQIQIMLNDLNERIGSYGILDSRPTLTEIKRSISLLRRYQIIELYEPLEALQADSRLLIYPSINLILYGEDVQAYLDGLSEQEKEEEPGLFEEEIDETIQNEQGETSYDEEDNS